MFSTIYFADNKLSIVDFIKRKNKYKVHSQEYISSKEEAFSYLQDRENISICFESDDFIENEISISSKVSSEKVLFSYLKKHLDPDTNYVSKITDKHKDPENEHNDIITFKSIPEEKLSHILSYIPDKANIKFLSSDKDILFRYINSFYKNSSYIFVFIDKKVNIIFAVKNNKLVFYRTWRFDESVGIEERLFDLEQSIFYMKKNFSFEFDFLSIQTNMDINLNEVSENLYHKVVYFEDCLDKENFINEALLSQIKNNSINFISSSIKKDSLFKNLSFVINILFILGIFSYSYFNFNLYTELKSIQENNQMKLDKSVVLENNITSMNSSEIEISNKYFSQLVNIKNDAFDSFVVLTPLIKFMAPVHFNYGEETLFVYFEKRFSSLKEFDYFQEDFNKKYASLSSEKLLITIEYKHDLSKLNFKAVVTVANKLAADEAMGMTEVPK